MNNYTEVLRREINLALGCTEPSAIALASAKSAEILNKTVEQIDLKVSQNIMKNAMSVGIPGTKLAGIEIAAALGAIAGKFEYMLEVLCDVSPADIEKAQLMLEENRVNVTLADTEERLYIEAVCKNGSDYASTIIKRSHTDIYKICYNDYILFSRNIEHTDACQRSDHQKEALSVQKVYQYITRVDANNIKFLKDVVEINRKIAIEGLNNNYGMNVGRNLYHHVLPEEKSRNLYAYATGLTAAAVDARMSGCSLPVMATTGSGNQGLTASLPVIAVAEILEKDEESLLRALALSELITIHIKTYIGKLSALCGCAIAASIGASCGIVYLLGGDFANIVYAIKNMIADISGLICDGAKPGCALKIATSVNGAIQCAMLAMNNIEASGKDGIVADCIEQTIMNLGTLGNRGMKETDHVILDMMLQK